jgi:hypothetical protein
MLLIEMDKCCMTAESGGFPRETTDAMKEMVKGTRNG